VVVGWQMLQLAGEDEALFIIYFKKLLSGLINVRERKSSSREKYDKFYQLLSGY
jgi:hypothetical protein